MQKEKFLLKKTFVEITQIFKSLKSRNYEEITKILEFNYWKIYKSNFAKVVLIIEYYILIFLAL